jgi:hypothetical protein
VPVDAALDAMRLAEVAGRLRIATLGGETIQANGPPAGELVLFG